MHPFSKCTSLCLTLADYWPLVNFVRDLTSFLTEDTMKYLTSNFTSNISSPHSSLVIVLGHILIPQIIVVLEKIKKFWSRGVRKFLIFLKLEVQICLIFSAFFMLELRKSEEWLFSSTSQKNWRPHLIPRIKRNWGSSPQTLQKKWGEDWGEVLTSPQSIVGTLV